MLIQAIPYPAAAGGGGPSYPTAVRAVWDAEDLAASLADNTDVASWPAQSGSFTITGGATKHKFRTGVINGRGVVRATTAGNGMDIPGTLLDGLDGSTGGTVIYVGKLDSTIGTGPLFGEFGNNSPHHYPWSDGHAYESFLGAGVNDWGDFASAMQSFHIGVLRAKTNYINWRIAEVQRYTSGSNTFTVNAARNSGSPPRLFETYRGGGPFRWNGDLAWWAFFEESLTDSDVLLWEADLATLFAL